jgi:hypothetical protein
MCSDRVGIRPNQYLQHELVEYLLWGCQAPFNCVAVFLRYLGTDKKATSNSPVKKANKPWSDLSKTLTGEEPDCNVDTIRDRESGDQHLTEEIVVGYLVEGTGPLQQFSKRPVSHDHEARSQDPRSGLSLQPELRWCCTEVANTHDE